jgi:hypothetical protein
MKKKRIAPLLRWLLASVLIHGLGWWLKGQSAWADAANALLLVSALLGFIFLVALLSRLSRNARPVPMD